MIGSPKVTLQDIAKQANVSVTTVSRVMNNQAGIGLKTRDKVLAIAQELNYLPSASLKPFASNSMQNIGLLIYKPSIPSRRDLVHSSLITDGIDIECQRRGYHLLTARVTDASFEDALQIPMIRENKVDGVILCHPYFPHSFLKEIHKSGLPIVLIDHYTPDSKIDCFLYENETGTYDLTNHLIQVHHHQKIVFLSGPQKWISNRERRMGYQRAMEEASLTPKVFVAPDTTFETGVEMMREALHNEPDLTGVVALNDPMALGAIHTCKSQRISVPGQVAVVGFDDYYTDFNDLPLTTVRTPNEEMGRLATRRLIDLIEHEPSDQFIRLKVHCEVQMIVRRSCGCGSEI